MLDCGPVLEQVPAGTPIDLTAYREAVARFEKQVACAPPNLDERHLLSWVSMAELSRLFSLLEGGVPHVQQTLIQELQRHRDRGTPSPQGHLLSDWLRIYLLSRIDSLWWDAAPQFATDEDIVTSTDLADADKLRRSGRLHFTYHLLPHSLPGRARDWARRKLLPGRRPRTAGLRLPRGRPEMLAYMNRLALDFKRLAPAHTPPLWVTSMVRSTQDQTELRTLGYAAFVPSAHSAGYAFDVEVEWFRRFGADSALRMLILGHQRDGAINAIDEGQIWHVCMSPEGVAEIERSGAPVGL